MKKLVLFCLLAALFSFKSQAQNGGAIKIKVIDSATNEGVPFALVTVSLNGINQGGTTTDLNGDGKIKPLKPGTYVVKVSYTGYVPAEIKKIIVTNDKITDLTVKLKSTAVD